MKTFLPIFAVALGLSGYQAWEYSKTGTCPLSSGSCCSHSYETTTVATAPGGCCSSSSYACPLSTGSDCCEGESCEIALNDGSSFDCCFGSEMATPEEDPLAWTTCPDSLLDVAFGETQPQQSDRLIASALTEE